MTNRSCFFADLSVKDEVEQLRMQEYAKASGFSVDLSTLKWTTSDSESYILVARNGGQMVSTMRGEVLDDISLLERKLECPWDFPLQLEMPVLLLSRAATCSMQRASGLNLVLRYWFLRLALSHKIRFVIGTFIAGSPRENSLKEMGYQFFENQHGWQQSTYRSLGQVKVAVLDLNTTKEQALRYCHDRAAKTIAEYEFVGDLPDLRFVRTL